MVLFAVTLALLPSEASTAPAAEPTPSAPPDPCTTILATVTRPSVTTSVCVVKPGHVLIETGYQNTTPDGGAPTAQYPQALIRVGTGIGGLEFSVAPPMFDRANGSTGTSDSAYGLKYEIGYTDKVLYGVNALLTVPSGSAAYSADGTGYTANANVLYQLSPVFSLATTVGYNDLASGSARYASFVPSLVLGAALAPSVSVFAEAAMFTHALGPASGTRVQFLAGVQTSIANKLQFDVEAGRSATNVTGKYRYLGVGLSYLH